MVDRTAYPRLPSTVSGRELAEALTPTAGEVRWACAKIVDPGARLSLLVLLKCYQRLGYFPQLDRVPSQVTVSARRGGNLTGCSDGAGNWSASAPARCGIQIGWGRWPRPRCAKRCRARTTRPM